jgi:hypothetical protein
MEMSKKENSVGCSIPFLGVFFSTCTAIVGQTIHGSFWWGIVDFLFWPLVWIKWLLYKDVNLTLIKESFNWFLQ